MVERQGSRSQTAPPALPSERRFGLLFAAIFAGAAAYAWFVSASDVLVACGIAAALLFMAASVLRPALLRPLNRAWAALGLLLGRIVSPIVLGAIFFLLITPVGWVTRCFGRDELRLRRQPRDSHWIARDPAGPSPESFRNQY